MEEFVHLSAYAMPYIDDVQNDEILAAYALIVKIVKIMKILTRMRYALRCSVHVCHMH